MKKNLKNMLLVSAMLAAVLVPTWSNAQPPAAEDATEVVDFLNLIKDIADPTFARYVSFDTIADAWDIQAPALLTDCALELAEAERILFRNLETITSEALLNKAIALAADQKDVETLDRIARYAAAAKKDALAAAVSSAKRLAGEERTILPVLAINLHSLSPDKFFAIKAVLADIDKARVNGRKSYLVALGNEISHNTELNEVLAKNDVESLRKYAVESEKITADSSQSEKETEETLDRLAGEERVNLGPVSKALESGYRKARSGIKKFGQDEQTMGSIGATTGAIFAGPEGAAYGAAIGGGYARVQQPRPSGGQQSQQLSPVERQQLQQLQQLSPQQRLQLIQKIQQLPPQQRHQMTQYILRLSQGR